MNRTAIITDIHGNLTALEATFKAIDEIGVDATYCGAVSPVPRGSREMQVNCLA